MISDEKIIDVVRGYLGSRGISGIFSELVDAHRNGAQPPHGFHWIRLLVEKLKDDA